MFRKKRKQKEKLFRICPHDFGETALHKTGEQTGVTLARVALRPVRVGALLVGLGGAPGRAVVNIRAAVVGPTLHLSIYPFICFIHTQTL